MQRLASNSSRLSPNADLLTDRGQKAGMVSKSIYLVANATLFDFFFIHGCRYEYIEHTLVCLGVCIVNGL